MYIQTWQSAVGAKKVLKNCNKLQHIVCTEADEWRRECTFALCKWIQKVRASFFLLLLLLVWHQYLDRISENDVIYSQSELREGYWNYEINSFLCFTFEFILWLRYFVANFIFVCKLMFWHGKTKFSIASHFDRF